jgi:hypothetical protein
MGVRFRTHRIRINITSFDKKDFPSLLEENKNWLPENPDYIRTPSGKESACKYLWDRVVVNWDGSVAPCCKIYNRSDAFSDGFSGDFMDIWNGEQYRRARGIFNGGKENSHFVCQRCVDRKGNI